MASTGPDRTRRGRSPRVSSPRARALSVIAAGAGAAAAIVLQRRHVRAVARDPVFAQLNEPLGGRPIAVRSSDGTRLHAESFGSDDGPTIVLAHGWTEQLTLWGLVIRILRERGLRLVAYDLRGHGESGPGAGEDYSLERFGDDVEAVVAAAMSGRAGELATVVGHSLGAMSIAAWAQRHDVAARAGAVAMVSTGLGDLITGHLLAGELAARLPSSGAGRIVLGSRARVPSFSSPLKDAVIRHVAFGPTATVGQVAFFEQMLVACPPAVRAAAGLAMSDMDLWEAVSRIDVPTLVVVGADDRLTPPAHARRIASTLPALAGLIELPRTGHMTPLERPAELADAIADLVTRTAPATRAAPA